MAISDVEDAIGCLSLAVPQFVAKELAHLTDTLVAGLESISDPLSDIGNTNVSAITDFITELGQGDAFGVLGAVATGFLADPVARELDALRSAMEDQYPNGTKMAERIANVAAKAGTAGYLFLSLVADAPYVAAQRLCDTLVELITLKIANLQCLRKHIAQLNNCILAMAKRSGATKSALTSDLLKLSGQLFTVNQELGRSQRVLAGRIVFDANAFGRAQTAMEAAERTLAPTIEMSQTLLGTAEILGFGTVTDAQTSDANIRTALMTAIPLSQFIEIELSAVVNQTAAINFHLQALAAVVNNFRSGPVASRVQETRSRLIAEISSRVTDLKNRVDLARTTGSVRAASAEMILWGSRIKAVLGLMRQVKDISFKEGSVNGPDVAAALATAYAKLITDIRAVNSANTVAGVEDIATLQTKVRAISGAAVKLLKDLEAGRDNPSTLATFHGLVAQTATLSHSLIDQSTSDSARVKLACEDFAALDIGARAQYDTLLDTLGQMGFDRAKDLLSTGDFMTYLDAGIQDLSYIGTVINCLATAIGAFDDVQSQSALAAIRDDLIGQQTNQQIAAFTLGDSRLRFLRGVQDSMTNLQKNGKVVENLLERLKAIGKQIGADVATAAAGVSELAGNIDHLAVGAGGRLSSGLEEFSKHPKAGAPLC